MRWLKSLGILALGLVAAGLIVRVMNPLPPLEGRSMSRALPPDEDTPLARAREAFAARVLLASACCATHGWWASSLMSSGSTGA